MPRPERALDDDGTTLTRFALGLRTLRARAGRPSYQRLAETAHYSVTTLSEAAGGRTFPTLAVTLAYVQACSGDVSEWEQTWYLAAAELAVESAPRTTPESQSETSPYVGLAAFEASDAHRFFGREKLVGDLVARVCGQRFVAVLGASGAGKSSILRAGLATVWMARGGPSTLITPGVHPDQAYETALATLGTEPGERLLIVDQFEEIFTLCKDKTERNRFLVRLLAHARDEHSGSRVVIGVRTDFYAHCADHAGLAEALQDGQFLVGPMTPQQLRSAIVAPAVQAGGNVETPLLAAMIADCSGESGVLPLLSHALRETWQRRSGSRMTLSGYQATGGIAYAIGRTAERTYGELDEPGRRTARSLFLRLTALGEGTGDTKRRVDVRELDTTDPTMATVLERLTTARLVIADAGRIEIAHEALIRCWPRLLEWLARDRQCLRIHRQLTEAATQWNLLGRDRGALYRGVRLGLTRELVSGPIELNTVEREFLVASTNEESRLAVQSRRRTIRLRAMVCVLSVLLVVAGTLSAIAVRAQDTARDQRDAAVSQVLLSEATSLSSSDPATAAQLSLAAYRTSPSTQARSVVLQAAESLRSFTAPIPGGFLMGMSPNGTLAAMYDRHMITLFALDSITHAVHEIGHIPAGSLDSDSIAPDSAEFSPSGRLMLIEYTNRPPTLYDITDPARPTLLSTLPDMIIVANFDSDRYLITEGTSNTVWDLIDPRHPKAISTFDTPPALQSLPLATVVGSEDGRVTAQVFHGNIDDTVVVLDTSTPGRPKQTWSVAVPGQTDDPVALSHGVLAVGTAPGTIYLWRVSNPRDVISLGTIDTQTTGVDTVAVSPDGTEVAASVGNTVDAWDIATAGRPYLVASVPTDSGNFPITTLVFQTGRGVVGQINDGGSSATQALWVNLPQSALLATTGVLAHASFSPDGTILSTDFSGIHGAGTQLWEVRQSGAVVLRATLDDGVNQLTGSDDSVPYYSGAGLGTIFSPQRHLLATTDFSDAMLWDITNPDRPTFLATLPTIPSEFSPDGTTLLGSNGSRWDLVDPRYPHQLPGMVDSYGNPVFSPDGSLVAFADNQQIAVYRVNGASTPEAAATINRRATSVAFSPERRTLVSASDDGRFSLWNLDDPARPALLATLQGQKDSVAPPVFSADGHYLAIPQTGNSTQVWNIQDPRHPELFVTLNDATPSQFDPNGKFIAVYTSKGDLELRPIDVAAAVGQLCAETPTISKDAWEQYASPLPYQPPCDGGIPAN